MIYKSNNQVNSIILLCGKPASGKTTLRNKILDRYTSIYSLSCDEEMLAKFGEIPDEKEFNEKLNLTKNMLYTKATKMLKSNNVILDFGFWYKAERDHVRHLFKEYNIVLIYLNVEHKTLIKNVQKRNAHLSKNEYYMDEATLNILANKFEPLDKSENYIEYTSDDTLYKYLDNILTKK